ncbi:MAG: acetylxylan esterase [Chloroflexi bacterium]|nr:acetylxylan esterase [Chloroflexota bacterium]MCY3581601.1 acetylxylan esterase [Chloroflexota bacterium]MCY3717404.1 acetylxylan esterase [Chloroflexota bacterium]MDE2650050.1 acetylxylan esterase [Chloroflexota bacterium]MXV93092.1 acetylxylan esterase [Chloroflexota bacterium]
MPIFDMPLDELRAYKPPRQEPADFDDFWRETLSEARQQDLAASFELIESGLETIDAYDVTFAGFGGAPIKGWFLVPKHLPRPLPAVVEYIGYGGGRGYPLEWLAFPSAGFAQLVMDTRGQGSVWRRGDTADMPNGANPAVPGYMTQGILDPRSYYYRRLYTDAVRAVDALLTRDDVDHQRIAVTGISQGGGLSIAVAGLHEAVAYCLPDVPFLLHFRRAVDITPSTPYSEIAKYLSTHRDRVDAVFDTLAYFDGVSFAARTEAGAYYSVGIMDTVCPPSTVYAAYNHVKSQKRIAEYHYNNHEGGGAQHLQEKIRFLREMWRA